MSLSRYETSSATLPSRFQRPTRFSSTRHSDYGISESIYWTTHDSLPTPAAPSPVTVSGCRSHSHTSVREAQQWSMSSGPLRSAPGTDNFAMNSYPPVRYWPSSGSMARLPRAAMCAPISGSSERQLEIHLPRSDSWMQGAFALQSLSGRLEMRSIWTWLFLPPSSTAPTSADWNCFVQSQCSTRRVGRPPSMRSARH